MSYILEALKQHNSNHTNSHIDVGSIQSAHTSIANELTKLVLLVISMGLLGGFLGIAAQHLMQQPHEASAAPMQLQTEQIHWPVFQTAATDLYFENPNDALPEITPSPEVIDDQANVAIQPAPVEISAQLKEQFAAAVRETEVQNEITVGSPIHESFSAQVPHLSELPYDFQANIPPMKFTSHMYSSDQSNRWIEVNGKKLLENQWIASNVRLISIRPQHVILQTETTRYSLPAMSEW